jgi:hypothetical protein
VPFVTESKGMTAAESRHEVDSEQERIEQWRAEELERAGYAPRQAARIAARQDIDLHLAVDLVRSGCSPDLAAQILI